MERNQTQNIADYLLISRRDAQKMTAFLVMDEQQNFGWMWKLHEGKRSISKLGGLFKNVQATPELVAEIQSRKWNEKMSDELKAFVSILWQKFCDENSNWRE